MALKSMTVKKGKEASGKVFGFRIGPKRVGNPSAGKIEIGDEPTRIDLTTQAAQRVGLEGQLHDLITRKYLSLVSSEELSEPSPQRGGK